MIVERLIIIPIVDHLVLTLPITGLCKAAVVIRLVAAIMIASLMRKVERLVLMESVLDLLR